MSCPMTESIDCLCQTTPHIILFEPTEPHSHKNLYHKMLASERRILEQSEKRTHTFPHFVTERACRWYRRCTKSADREECEALELFESARGNTLAAAYNVNASTKHLEEKMKSREMVKMSIETVKTAEDRKCSVVTVETCEVGYNEGQVRKGSISITTTALLPSSSSSSTHASEASTLPTSAPTSTETVIHYRRPSLDLSIDSCDECHQVDTAEERRALLTKWGQVDGEEVEALGRKWWKRFSMGRR
ncbi:MAG: hypothetical protein LQ343_004484 [Gyalolechia ehrenbergii]|nr:MAG: hypothetical protein LQ343_004484 [Gyalolechia ehrenbergii]